jgi:hypothetical protein
VSAVRVPTVPDVPPKWSVERWAYLGRRLAAGASVRELARELGISWQAVSAARRKLLPPRAPVPPDIEARAQAYAVARWDFRRRDS